MSRLAAALLLFAFPAAAGSIAGHVRDGSGAPLAGIDVRLWSCVQTDELGCKTWGITAAVTTPGDGSYAFSGISGAHLVDARPGAGVTTQYTDRWYAPGETAGNTAGFTGGTAVDSSLAPANIDIVMIVGGGIDGLMHAPGGGLLSGVFVRAELDADPRIHHNDASQADPHLGEFYFRNLPPLGTYDVLSYWQPGTYETQLTPGISLGIGVSVTMAAPASGDPWNGSSNVTLTGAAHNQKFTSAGAMIAPLNAGDTDQFCFAASAGDRFRLAASADVIPGTSRASPFVDPILRFTGPGLAAGGIYDDDSGGGLDSLIQDTGELAGGTYCARVSTFGDTAFNGTTQGSTGRFVFQALLLNRRPTVTANVVPPPAPGFVEGGTVTVNLSFHDADGDAMTPSAALADANNAADTTGALGSITASGAVFTWTIPQGASANDPFVATFKVTDAFGDAYSTSLPATATIAINAIAVPQQISPDDGARAATAQPPLEIQDLVDNAQAPVSYQYELYDHAGALMAQSGTVPLDPSGHMVYVPPPLPENERVTWRVRAIHGTAHSAWTGFRGFLVDATNEPPPAPVLVKPGAGEEVLVRQPGLAATSAPDPEGDAVSLVFELSDAQGTLVEQSDPIPVTLASTTTPWTPSHVLAWGGAYSARAYAVDARGGHSGYSDAVPFTVRADGLPAAPALQGPFATQCQGEVLHAAPPSIPVANVEDPDGEPVTLELQLLDSAGGAPLLDVTQPQGSGASTAMDTSTMKWSEDAHYRVRSRAGDGTAWTSWSECDFTLDEVPAASDGGAVLPDGGTGPGTDGGTGTPDGAHRGGCSTTGATGPALLLLAAFVLLRRRGQ